MNSNSKAVSFGNCTCHVGSVQSNFNKSYSSICCRCVFFVLRSKAPTLRNVSVEVMQAWRAWYFLSCNHGVIKIGPEILEQKSNILHVVQPTMHSTLDVHDICPLIRVVSCPLPLLFLNPWGHQCTNKVFCLPPFYLSRCLRQKNTRLSTAAQLQCLCSRVWVPGNKSVFLHPTSLLAIPSKEVWYGWHYWLSRHSFALLSSVAFNCQRRS